MRHTQVCPKCDGRRFAVQPQFRLPSHDSSNGTELVPAATAPRGWSRDELGHFEAWSCVGCGFTEFYAALGDFERFARENPEQMRLVDRTPPTRGPHR